MTLALDTQIANETGTWIGINDPEAKILAATPRPDFEQWVEAQKRLGYELTEEGRWVALRLYINQQNLRKLKASVGERVEIRISRHRPSMGYFIVDAKSIENKGVLIATPYLFQIDTEKGKRSDQDIKNYTLPILLSKVSAAASDSWWFEQYVEEFERLWNNAAVWEPS